MLLTTSIGYGSTETNSGGQFFTTCLRASRCRQPPARDQLPAVMVDPHRPRRAAVATTALASGKEQRPLPMRSGVVDHITN